MVEGMSAATDVPASAIAPPEIPQITNEPTMGNTGIAANGTQGRSVRGARNIMSTIRSDKHCF